ncbi:DUF2570 domain-containing protein [Pseudescherichia sp.]|uniref:DUF2570 domain-containing protein n=1 Tax=Pseudescherichia sp. TaxID=2055881 RepID=UPI00289C7905|nr:DUF2570 domain-containing protein [Pseudescherichia sp.]
MNRLAVLFSGAALALLAAAGLAVFHYGSQYAREKNRADNADRLASSAAAVAANLQRTVSIFNTVTEANQHAKNQITLDVSSAAREIHSAVANDECALRTIPADADSRLRHYATRLGSRTAAPAPVQFDR